MEIGHIIPHIEALVFASDKPLTPIDITELVNNAFGFMDDKLTLEQVQSAIEGIVEKYRSDFYPFEMRESGGGWQFLTKKEYHKTVAQLNGDKFLKKLSTAALETLAIIAYKQPITKSEIESIRGVSCDYSIQKLLEKELIVISGRNEELPGKPLIYNTSRTFMDYFGINSPEDLPKLKEIFSENGVDPTVVGEARQEDVDLPELGDAAEEARPLVVTETGELQEESSEPVADTGFDPEAGTDGQLEELEAELRDLEEELAEFAGEEEADGLQNEGVVPAGGEEEQAFPEEEISGPGSYEGDSGEDEDEEEDDEDEDEEEDDEDGANEREDGMEDGSDAGDTEENGKDSGEEDEEGEAEEEGDDDEDDEDEDDEEEETEDKEGEDDDEDSDEEDNDEEKDDDDDEEEETEDKAGEDDEDNSDEEEDDDDEDEDGRKGEADEEAKAGETDDQNEET